MVPLKRRKKIVEILGKETFATVEQLSKMIFASDSTIRRDLVILEKEGIIRRSHGGAALVREDYVEWPVLFRHKDNIKEKELIAEKAVSLVKNDQTIIIDSSSTCFFLAKLMLDFKGLTVLTNGIMTAHYLSENSTAQVIMCPGKIYSKGGSINGADTCEYISRHSADISFISCRGISSKFGISDFTEAEAQVKRSIRNSSRKIAVLADYSKFEKEYFYQGISSKEIDYLFSDIENTDEVFSPVLN